MYIDKYTEIRNFLLENYLNISETSNGKFTIFFGESNHRQIIDISLKKTKAKKPSLRFYICTTKCYITDKNKTTEDFKKEISNFVNKEHTKLVDEHRRMLIDMKANELFKIELDGITNDYYDKLLSLRNGSIYSTDTTKIMVIKSKDDTKKFHFSVEADVDRVNYEKLLGFLKENNL